MDRTCFLILLAGFLFTASLTMTGCATAPTTDTARTSLRNEARATVSAARRSDPSLSSVLNRSRGYAVFPTVGKGAIGVGGAYGRGVLFQSGSPLGYCDLSQASIGFQIGGQSYSEIIVFESRAAVETFKQGNFHFDAQATAVALTAGAGANARFADGVMVFTFGEAGLMYEASIGGQKFSYSPR